MREILETTDHRPWPLPSAPWVLAQTWEHLLFMHWPLAPEILAPLIPPGLELETFDGKAWIGIVPFRMAWVRPRALPAWPRLSFFPELNVRTYVRAGHMSGVWFLSLDADSRTAVRIARQFFRLPYFDADMRIEHEDETVHYASERVERGAPPADFVAHYRPTGNAQESAPGTLEHFLTERYCLYTADDDGGLYRAHIHHAPWSIHRAEAQIEVNTMLAGHGIGLPEVRPLLHFAPSITVATWPLLALD